MHPLNNAIKRTSRAQKHLRDLKRREARFSQQQSNSLSVNLDLKPIDFAYGFSRESTIPAGFGILVGEVIYNLRAALDYLVYELAAHDSGRVQNGTQFPIEDAPQGFSGRAKTYLVGLNQRHITLIEGLQPYKGVDWTRLLRDISNPDKHRQLTPVRRTFDGTISIEFVDPAIGPESGALPISARYIDRTEHGIEVYVYHEITTYVALPDGGSVVELLEILQSQVAQTVEQFKTEFE